jgi:sigma-B regulation protein RsbU (phosphoserine phosphatase)
LENGLMLGPFGDSPYSAGTLSLEPGDRVLLFTDGLLEVKNAAGREFGVDGVRQILQCKHDLPPGRFADALLYALSNWSEDAIGPRQADDITIIAIGFQGTSS